MKKNILFIIESSETGGAENVFAELVKRIDRTKYTPHVALLYEGWLFDHLTADGICIHMIPTGKGGFDFRLLCGIISAIRKLDIDLVHSHLFTTNVYASVCGAITGVPVISTFHGTMDVDLGGSFNWIKWAAINRFSSKIVFVSKYLQDYFIRHKLANRGKSEVIYNGIDFNRFCNGLDKTFARRAIGIPENSFVIGCVGDLRPAKDYHSALHAVAILKEKIPNLKLVIAGSITEMLGDLELLAKDLGIFNMVHFLGFQQYIENIIPSFDVYLSSSISEGFSLSVVEAMAANVPVVATRSGGPEEIISSGVNGLLVNIQEPESIVEAIVFLYSHCDVTSKLVGAGLKNAENNFTSQAMVDAYQSIYCRSLLCSDNSN